MGGGGEGGAIWVNGVVEGSKCEADGHPKLDQGLGSRFLFSYGI